MRSSVSDRRKVTCASRFTCNILFVAAPCRACIRSRSCYLSLRPIGLAFAAAHVICRCALSGLHSQPLMLFVAAPYRACIRSRSCYLLLRPVGLAFAAAHVIYGCALSGLHSQPLMYVL